MNTLNNPVALITVFVWVGFIAAISFMEAWLKFRAPGITLPLGLGIGRIVFGALNKMEWLFVVAIIGSILLSNNIKWQFSDVFFVLSFCILIIQSVWLLPALDARAAMIIAGEKTSPSNLHFYYVGVEFIKIMGLCLFGVSLIKPIQL